MSPSCPVPSPGAGGPLWPVCLAPVRRRVAPRLRALGRTRGATPALPSFTWPSARPGRKAPYVQFRIPFANSPVATLIAFSQPLILKSVVGVVGQTMKGSMPAVGPLDPCLFSGRRGSRSVWPSYPAPCPTQTFAQTACHRHPSADRRRLSCPSPALFQNLEPLRAPTPARRHTQRGQRPQPKTAALSRTHVPRLPPSALLLYPPAMSLFSLFRCLPLRHRGPAFEGRRTGAPWARLGAAVDSRRLVVVS